MTSINQSLMNEDIFSAGDYDDDIPHGRFLAFIYRARERLMIQEEFLVLSTPSLFTSLGGSLGLFLGFSCYSVIDSAMKNLSMRISWEEKRKKRWNNWLFGKWHESRLLSCPFWASTPIKILYGTFLVSSPPYVRAQFLVWTQKHLRMFISRVQC